MFLVALALYLVGCGAHFNSIYRSEDIGSRHASFISQDAKQRGIIHINGNHNGQNRTIMCIEPSPDALTVLATAASADVDVIKKVSASLWGSSNETGANIGIRTPSIQALRDSMYRICEAFASQGISEDAYASLLHRYQNVLVALIAIEQLTGMAVTPPIAISGAADIVNGEALAKLQEHIEAQTTRVGQAQQQVSTAKKAHEEAKKALEADPKNDAKKTAVTGQKQAVEKAEEKLKDEELDLEALKESRSTARTPNLQLRSLINMASATPYRDYRNIEKISETVGNIVNGVLARSYIIDFCQRYYMLDERKKSSEITTMCDNNITNLLNRTAKPDSSNSSWETQILPNHVR